MSWQAAKREAERWLVTLDLPKPLRGEYVDLAALAKGTLEFEGQFRWMVLKSAARMLKKKGATSNISEE